MAILENKARCLVCKDVLVSRSVHDFRTCSCGSMSVDGGREYVRRVFMDSKLVEEMTTYSEEETSPLAA